MNDSWQMFWRNRAKLFAGCRGSGLDFESVYINQLRLCVKGQDLVSQSHLGLAI